MKRFLFTFLLFLILSPNAKSQSFLAQYIKASVGTSICLPVNGFANYYSGDTYQNFHASQYFDFSVFPPKVEARVGTSLDKRIEVELFGAYHGLQNSGVRIKAKKNEGFYTYEYIDSFTMRTNAFQLGLDFKAYFGEVPFGAYFFGGFALSSTHSTVYPTLYHSKTNIGSTQEDNTTVDRYKLESWKTSSSCFGINFGIGMSVSLNENLFIDFGARSAFNLFKPKPILDTYSPFEEVSEYDYQFASEAHTKFVSWTNIQSSNVFQFYVRLGYIK